MRIHVTTSDPWMFGVDFFHFYAFYCIEVHFWKWHVRLYVFGWGHGP